MINQVSFALLGLSAMSAKAFPRPSPQDLDWTVPYCQFSVSTPAEAEAAWMGTGVTGVMMNEIDATPDTRKGWVRNLDAKARGIKPSQSSADCGSLGGMCQLLNNCNELHEKQMWEEYWVFKAVMGAHDLANYLREGLQDNAIMSSLSIGQLVEFWKPEDKGDKTILTYLAAAFSMASAGSAVNPGASAGFGFASGLASAAAEANSRDPPEYRGSLETVILHMFQTTRDAIRDSLKAAMGDNPDYIPNLPQGSITGFFGQGRYLFDSVSTVGDPIIAGMYKRMRQALMGVILQKTNHWILVDEGYKSDQKEECTRPGAYWHDATSSCYYIIENAGGSAISCLQGNVGDCNWRPLKQDQVDNILSYGVDLPEMYKNACQCQYSTGGEPNTPDAQNLPQDGSMPKCFYPLKCMVGTPMDFNWDSSEVLDFGNVPEAKVPY